MLFPGSPKASSTSIEPKSSPTPHLSVAKSGLGFRLEGLGFIRCRVEGLVFGVRRLWFQGLEV